MATVRLDGLRKEFDSGRIVAVDDLSIDIDDGEFVTVVGPSGCGKSTTLRMIAGLERPTSGSIHIGGTDVTDIHARDRDIAMVFQNYALYPHKTVFENMEFGLRMSTDLSRDQRREQVYETAEMMGIEDLLEDHPDELSGGQKQRVALGRAIVREPDVFLFDEPLSNLDAKLRTSMRTEIQRLQEELDITAIYVTHDQEEAMTMGDRMVILNNGELQQVGAPKHVYRNPTNAFVGGFVGSPSMNFLDVTAVPQVDDRLRLEGESFEYTLPNPGVPEGDYTLGVRPEHVTVVGDDVEHAIQTRVDVLEPVGSDNYLYLDLGDDFIARVPADVEPAVGESVRIAFSEDAVHLFDRRTGEAVSQSSRSGDGASAPEPSSA
ncbi:ABC transporter ATP-binding protein [Halarchaeum sp. P4]|uniref:ABC transporter ATP-binding protein n=1 Tax=Halarchaeum sp. P4 TaxID=3421639 RepID=UPI003EB716E7